MTRNTANTRDSRPYTYHRDRDGCFDTWEIDDPDGRPLAFVRFWDSVDGEEDETESAARRIVRRLNGHDELLAALTGLLAAVDERKPVGVRRRDARLTRARRVAAEAAAPANR